MQLSLQRPTPHIVAFLVFLAYYCIVIIDIRHVAWRDPSSIFFNPALAFERHYSLTREAQANDYIDIVENSIEIVNYTKAGLNPTFCVGIPTLQREGARYFSRAVGSILAGLTEEERKDLWLVGFIVDLDPKEHLAYNEKWLKELSDQVITYDDVDMWEMRGKVENFSKDDFRKKALVDYTVLLKECYKKGVPWVVMLEDDVVGADGWFARTKKAVEGLAGRRDFHDMLYLRLFYNERLLGWNSEEWLGYVVRSLLVEISIAAILFAALRYVPHAPTYLTSRTLTTILFVCTPICITLYFAAGRLTVASPSTGLNRMDTYGCCSQAFVFPREQIPDLINWYESQPDGGFVDVLTETYANDNDLARWALTPSVFQHVGSKSSKGSFDAKWGRSNTENIWNFSFERFDEEELEEEHFG